MLRNFGKNVNSGLQPASEQDRLMPTLFVLQAGCINVVGIASILSGVAPPLVVLIMVAQGTYLIADAQRALSKGQ